MQDIQGELEEISAQNAELEQDFANEIDRKNKNSQEVGQIINSINNIYEICKRHSKKRTAKNDSVKITEETKNLVEELIPRLETAHQTVDELVKVYQEYGRDYDREKAYTEEIDVKIEEGRKKMKED